MAAVPDIGPKRWLRLDLTHEGDCYDERIRIHSQRLVTARAKPCLPEPDDRGEYRWLLESKGSRRCLASLGYSPLYGEWRSTLDDSTTERRSFLECLYCPLPEEPAWLLVQKRKGAGGYETRLAVELDPAEVRAPASPPLQGDIEIVRLGTGSTRRASTRRSIDLLLIGDGYGPHERRRFLEDAARFASALFSCSPYDRRRGDFDLAALYVPSPASGSSDPATGEEVDSVLGCAYGTLGIDRYLLPRRLDRLYDLCDQAPCDLPVILCNSDKFGGGGLFNQYCCLSAGSRDLEYLVVHEFAHAFAGLADEYYTAPVTYRQPESALPAPWEANVSGLDEQGRVKWSRSIAPETPVPTPWRKQAYEDIMRRIEEMRSAGADPATDAMEGLYSTAARSLASEEFAGQVGAFEGAAYRERGLFRPEVDCLMFSRRAERFCTVCEEAIARTIDRYLAARPPGPNHH